MTIAYAGMPECPTCHQLVDPLHPCVRPICPARSQDELATLHAQLSAAKEEIERLTAKLSWQEKQTWECAETAKGLAAELSSLRERLKAVEQKCIHPEYDYPGDAPEICCYSCQLCDAEGPTAENMPHHETCPFSLAALTQEVERG